MTVEGTFNVQLFFDTLANILGQKNGMKITVKVTEKYPKVAGIGFDNPNINGNLKEFAAQKKSKEE